MTLSFEGGATVRARPVVNEGSAAAETTVNGARPSTYTIESVSHVSSDVMLFLRDLLGYVKGTWFVG